MPCSTRALGAGNRCQLLPKFLPSRPFSVSAPSLAQAGDRGGCFGVPYLWAARPCPHVRRPHVATAAGPRAAASPRPPGPAPLPGFIWALLPTKSMKRLEVPFFLLCRSK